MSLHSTHKTMVKESLREFLAVAEYCVGYRKDYAVWDSSGCFGYPANVLLLAIADAIGSYVLGGNTRNHFNILTHPDYYNLTLKKEEVTIIYEAYRCLGTHNLVLGKDVVLDIGEESDPVYSGDSGNSRLNLKPFLILTKGVVERFLDNVDTLVPDEVTKQ